MALNIEKDFPLVSGEIPKIRYVVLDSWRGIAALIVAAYHLQIGTHLYYSNIMRNSWLFVDFFFVLSGYVISHAYSGKLNSISANKKFLIRRFGRLWPLHIVMLLLFIFAELVLLALDHKIHHLLPRPPFSKDRTWQTILPNVLLLNGMGLNGQPPSWNSPSWSISVEFYTYLLFAWATFVGGRFGKAIPAFLIFLSVVALCLIAAGYRGALSDLTDFFRCVFAFFVGHYLWRGRHLGLFLEPTLMELISIILIVLYVIMLTPPFQIVAPVIFGLAIHIFSKEKGILSKFLKRNVFQDLGLWSYSIYMVHFFICFVIFNCMKIVGKLKLLPSIPQPTDVVVLGNRYWMDATLCIYLCIVVGVASVAFRAIERPGITYFNKRARCIV